MLSRYISIIIDSAKSRWLSGRNRLHRFRYWFIAICLIFSVYALVLTHSELDEIPSDVSIIHILPADWNPYQRLYDELLAPTVRISSANGVGSGVIIHRRDAENAEKSIYILTAAHVVDNYSNVTVTFYTPLTPPRLGRDSTIVTLNRGEFSLTAFVVMTDTNKDLALLKLNLSNPYNLRLYTAKLAPKDYKPFIFTPVYAVGCSLGLNPRPSSGIISAIHLSGLCISAVEISAPILPGNSGGPVFDANTHEVIGIAVWVHTYKGQLITTMAGVVPISEIHKFLDEFYHKDTKTLRNNPLLSPPLLRGIKGDVCASAVNNSSVNCISLSEVSLSKARTWGTMNRKTGLTKKSEVTTMLISGVDLWIPSNVPPKADMGAKWEQVIQLLATLINDRRNEKIPDEAAYQNKLVELSNQAWANVLNPAYRSKRGKTYNQMKNTHDTNLQASYEKWKDNIEYLFATVDGIPAKRFKDRISLTKKFWESAAGKKVLRLTGDRIRGEGAATIATYWLTGEPKAAGMLRPQDTHVVGGPYRICQDTIVQALKAALMSRLVQAGVMILNSNYDAAVITEENDITNHLVQSLINPGLGLTPFATGGISHVDFVKDGALLKLSIQVDQI